jgi:hypothetical protein
VSEAAPKNVPDVAAAFVTVDDTDFAYADHGSQPWASICADFEVA